MIETAELTVAQQEHLTALAEYFPLETLLYAYHNAFECSNNPPIELLALGLGCLILHFGEENINEETRNNLFTKTQQVFPDSNLTKDGIDTYIEEIHMRKAENRARRLFGHP